MENLTKYIMGVAAKSNIEKRKVGCLLLNASGDVIGEGFNTDEYHAEAEAIHVWKCSPLRGSTPVKALVTHQPCPKCASELQKAGVKEVEIVEAFMKFDGDKVRLDLVDPGFAKLALDFPSFGDAPNNTEELEDLKKRLYDFQESPGPYRENVVDLWKYVLGGIWPQYDNFYVMEESLAKVLTFGARKYKPNNWKECADTGRYLAAAHRHLNAVITGEDNDPETGLPHLDHMLCNVMFLHVLGLSNG